MFSFKSAYTCTGNRLPYFSVWFWHSGRISGTRPHCCSSAALLVRCAVSMWSIFICYEKHSLLCPWTSMKSPDFITLSLMLVEIRIWRGIPLLPEKIKNFSPSPSENLFYSLKFSVEQNSFCRNVRNLTFELCHCIAPLLSSQQGICDTITTFSSTGY